MARTENNGHKISDICESYFQLCLFLISFFGILPLLFLQRAQGVNTSNIFSSLFLQQKRCEMSWAERE